MMEPFALAPASGLAVHVLLLLHILLLCRSVDEHVAHGDLFSRPLVRHACPAIFYLDRNFLNFTVLEWLRYISCAADSL